MSGKLSNYSRVLQLDTETILAYKWAPDGLVRALRLFFVVTLIAGLGIWLGIPVQLERPVLYEIFADAQGTVTDISNSVQPFLEQSLPLVDDPSEIAQPIGEAADAASETINNWLQIAENEAELLEPPLGTRASRVIHLFGRWISVPFAIMSGAIGYILVAMLVAKSLGGKATLTQHLTAALLAAAPLVLLLPSFIPDLSLVMPVTFAIAISIFSRIIAVVGLIWAVLILLKGMALAHEFSWWRAGAVLALSWLIVTILLPLLTVLAAGYILPL